MKRELIDEVNVLLLKKGFTVKNLTGNSFDILARKSEDVLMVKILENANSISHENANEMKNTASYFSAVPLIIANFAGERIEDNIVYSRFGLNTINLQTLSLCLDRILPFVRSTKAGPAAQLSAERLRCCREENSMSLAELSQRVGVSRRMVARYEAGDCEITLDRAVRVHDILGEGVFEKIDLLRFGYESVSSYRSTEAQKYVELGFSALEPKRMPFDIISKRGPEIILTDIGDRYLDQTLSLSKLLDAKSLVIFEKRKPKDVPSVKREEFLDFGSASELIKFLKDF
ncbi:MAG: helix-turn-helix domain-containing protein [archaeon]